MVVGGLDFPTSVTLGDDGTLYIAESGLAFGGARPGGRVRRVESDGSTVCLRDDLRAPVNGLTFHDGCLYVSEGGHPGRISRLAPDGEWTVLLDGLPGLGNYHTNMAQVGPDGWLYFGQGALTNSGIVGPDSLGLAWLRRLPHACDIPGYDVVLTGAGAECDDPFPTAGAVGDGNGWGALRRDRGAKSAGSGGDGGVAGTGIASAENAGLAATTGTAPSGLAVASAANGFAAAARRVSTGAFCPFGEQAEAGRRLRGQVPATAAVMRWPLDAPRPRRGAEAASGLERLELVAWGLRNPYGLAFLPDGRLLATDQGADDRGSRPIGNVPDYLYEVRQGAWYGWPDYAGGVPVTDERFRPQRGPAPRMLLANHPELPPPERPLLSFAVNAAATKLAVVPPDAGRWPGQLLVALFGDERPFTAPPGERVGRSLARIDPDGWTLHRIAPMREIVAGDGRGGRGDGRGGGGGGRGGGAPGWHRPIDVCCAPDGESVYLLDFGEFEMGPAGMTARAGSGALWSLPMAAL